jgi:hypothetical protein
MDLPMPHPENIKHPLNSIWLEHNVQRIITQQEINGVQFNSTRARLYIHALRERQAELYRQIRPSLSLELTVPYPGPVQRPYTKAGGLASQVKKWYEGHELPSIGGPFTRVHWLEPDLQKRAKLVAQLLHLGWKPSGFTEKGNPQLKIEGEPCPNLQRIGDGLGKAIADWYIYRHREGQIHSLLKLVRPDGRISAEAICIGTPTFRFRHKGVVNIPKASPHVLFGRQMRSLFTVGDVRKRKMVGHDASGLELRMLADAINDEEFTMEVIDGDVHSKNQRDAGLPTRDDAKTFIYAFIYGAGDGKLGSIVGGGVQAGRRIRAKFLQNNPRLAACIESTKRASERGFLIGLDGRKITMRRDKFTGEVQTHKALNTRLQSAGAIVMKWSMVVLDQWVREMTLDVMKVIDMHDEGQNDVADKDVPLMQHLAPASIVEAGRILKLNVPLAGDCKVGTNWSQTH